MPACAPNGAPNGSNPAGGAWKPWVCMVPRIKSRQRLQKNCSTGSSQSPTQTSPQSMPGMSLRGLRWKSTPQLLQSESSPGLLTVTSQISQVSVLAAVIARVPPCASLVG